MYPPSMPKENMVMDWPKDKRRTIMAYPGTSMFPVSFAKNVATPSSKKKPEDKKPIQVINEIGLEVNP